MSRSYKKPFVKMAKDVEFQKMANREFRRKAKNVLRGSADPERHMPEKNRKEGDCWGGTVRRCQTAYFRPEGH